MSGTLADWGWDERREVELLPLAEEGWMAGRVVRPGRGIWRLVVVTNGDLHEIDARLSGRALGREEAPGAGDWVAWRQEGGTGIIGAVLDRRTVISRKAAGTAAKEQVIAANVDDLFIVQALGKGRGFTPRGLERYLAMAWESGCRPLVVLNKADLAPDPAGDRLDAEAAAPGVDVLVCSVLGGAGVGELGRFLAPGRTAAFVGPSGVGKSSIINAIAGERLAATGEVRDQDRRGRHTTTHRELHRLPGGPLLLDTPGLREVQLWGTAATANMVFPEIDGAAQLCRYSDCGHDNEPGCAVRAALAEGQIQPDRFDSWLELHRELAQLENRRDERARRKQAGKKLSKLIRNHKKGKDAW
ncbi:ribosome small subunit-dependent GTPase A [Myxococcota bacterium]